jgi:hypothetical protein
MCAGSLLLNVEHTCCSLECLVHCLEVAIEDGVHLRAVLRVQELALQAAAAAAAAAGAAGAGVELRARMIQPCGRRTAMTGQVDAFVVYMSAAADI